MTNNLFYDCFSPHFRSRSIATLSCKWAVLLVASVLSLCTFTATSDGLPGSTSGLGGYCLPADSCWPSDDEWAALNKSGNGNLIIVRPISEPCFSEGAESAACAEVATSYHSQYWRSAQPGAMMYPVWEANTTSGESCIAFEFGPPPPECFQGDVSPVAVNVSSEEDVAAALAFAQKHNIRVVIKSSGNDLLGRSAAGGSLLIWMKNLKGYSIDENFEACEGDEPIPVISGRPGDTWGTLYGALANSTRFTLMAGTARTVSACGGYVMAGGHGFQGPAYGLGVDNVVKFTAVLANGTVVKVSSCEHPDLFWALRGGGPVFAVITKATYRLHELPPDGVTGASLTVGFVSADAVKNFLNKLLEVTPSLTSSPETAGGVWGGYIGMHVAGEPAPYCNLNLVFNNTADLATASLADLQGFLMANNDTMQILDAGFEVYDNFILWHNVTFPAIPGDPVGYSSQYSSRMIPLSATSTAEARAKAVEAIYSVGVNTLSLDINWVVGGAVSAFDRDSTETSVTPAWRDAVWHMTFRHPGLPANFSDYVAQTEAVSEWTGILREAFPDSGAYFSESDFLEPDWQKSYWGLKNYARLQTIKAAYDPAGVFTCHHCVTDAASDETPSPPVPPPSGYSVDFVPANDVTAGDAVSSTWNSPTGSLPNEFIGFYRTGGPDAEAYAMGNLPSGKTTGTWKVTLPQNIESAKYEFRYVRRTGGSSFETLATSPSVTVGQYATWDLAVNTSTASDGDSVVYTWEATPGVPPQTSIGLRIVGTDTSYILQSIIQPKAGSTGGTESVTILPGVPAAKYELAVVGVNPKETRWVAGTSDSTVTIS